MAARETNPAPEGLKNIAREHDVRLHDEWGLRRRHHRRLWCLLREIGVLPGDPAYLADVLARHPHAVARLRRTFETMRGENGLLERKPHGAHIDIDAFARSGITGIQPQDYTRMGITIDRASKNHLPRMYGTANFVVVDDVAALPLKVADVYGRLTR